MVRNIFYGLLKELKEIEEMKYQKRKVISYVGKYEMML